MPEKAIPIALHWLENSNVQLRITKSRSSKLGDYRPPVLKKYHRISVNHDLNQFHFLITLVHEYAHLKNWEQHQRNVKPHGPEWQKAFREYMQPFLQMDIFPSEAFRKPPISFIKVVFPQPEGPSIVTNSPFRMERFTSSRTFLSPKKWDTCSTAMMLLLVFSSIYKQIEQMSQYTTEHLKINAIKIKIFNNCIFITAKLMVLKF